MEAERSGGLPLWTAEASRWAPDPACWKVPRLDPKPPAGQCRRAGWDQLMKLLSHLSPDGSDLPRPADDRRLYLGFEAWNEALGLAQGQHAVNSARKWSAAPAGK